MFIVGNLINAVAVILDWVLKAYGIVVFVAVLVQWVSPDPFNPIVQTLRSITEPVFSWVRQRLPFLVVGALDLTPMAVILAIAFIRMFAIASLYQVALRLR
ncbi:MAG: YggT family protein [Candidatus Omnitrophica bacterium]|nr:YggT family protein [Candidatus Omnitrophota bacterium]